VPADWKFCPLCAAPLAVKPQPDDRDRLACSVCDFIRYENPTPVVAAIVMYEGDVVLARNKGWPDKLYGLVTGFLEKGEGPELGVLREVKEELGLDGTITAFVGHYDFELMNQLIIAYEIHATGTLVVGHELEGIKRVPPHKLRPWPYGTGAAVRDWLARRTPATAATTPPEGT